MLDGRIERRDDCATLDPRAYVAEYRELVLRGAEDEESLDVEATA